MSSVLTNKFRIHNAKSFKEGFNEVEFTNIYTTIGKISPWLTTDIYSGANDNTSDSNPPIPLDHVQNEYEVWRNMFAAKKVQPNDVIHVIPRVDWESGKIYTQYSDMDATLVYDIINNSTPKPFYVMTDEFNVYKCLFNNNIESTVKPTGTSTAPLTMSDGYVWKYMYTISASNAFKFMTDNFIPVQTLEVEPIGGSVCSSGNLQWNVQQYAKNYGKGKLEVISRNYGAPSSGGSGYVSESGTTIGSYNYDSNADVTLITVDGTFSQSDDYYNDMTVYFETEQLSFLIQDFVSASGVNINDSIVLEGDASSIVSTSFKILPTAKIEGDGSGAKAIPIMGSPSVGSSVDQIDKVKILNGGSDYTSASITFINANGVSNTDANFDVIIPPTGGHGSDAIKELGGFFIMINTRFQYNEYDFPVDNDYRQISLIRHPKKSDGTDATDDAYVQCKTLVVSVSNIDETSGSLGSDQILSQDQGGGKIVKATIVDVLDDSVNNNKKIRIVGSSEDFSLSTPLSSSSGVIINSIESIEGIGLMEDSGDVIFVEQRKSIQRDASQVEDIKIILEF